MVKNCRVTNPSLQQIPRLSPMLMGRYWLETPMAIWSIQLPTGQPSGRHQGSMRMLQPNMTGCSCALVLMMQVTAETTSSQPSSPTSFTWCSKSEQGLIKFRPQKVQDGQLQSISKS